MPSNLAGLGVIYNDSAGLNQTIFQLNAVPGSLTLVHVDGKVINPATYIIDKSVLIFDDPIDPGAWVYVISGQGGTFVTQSYVDQAVAPKASKDFVNSKILNLMKITGGTFTGPINVSEPTSDMNPVTLQLWNTLPEIATPEYVNTKTDDKVTTNQFNSAMDSVIGEDQKGAPNRVPDLDGGGDIKIAQVPSVLLRKERSIYRGVNPLTVGVGGEVWVPRNAGWLRTIQLWLFTGPIGADFVVDILKNDVSIFSSPADKLIVADGTRFKELNLPVSTTFNKGDVFKYNVTQVGSTTPGGWLNLILEYEIAP